MSEAPQFRVAVLGGVVFLASGAVLVLEILAGRILAPFVGVTLQSFTGIIGTVLAAIALGAWAGGRLADRVPPERLLGPVLGLGAVLAVITPAAVTLLGDAWTGDDPSKIVGLAFVGFFAPAAVLSTVTPLGAKIALRSLDATGTVVGTLSALATMGALFGTFITGFVLVANFPSKPITWIVGALLLAAAIVVSVPPIRTAVVGGGAALLVAVAVSAAVASPCQVETAYFCADVRVDPNRPTGRELILDTLRHSYVDIEDPTHLGSRYARVIAAVVDGLADGPIDVLFIGGGGFTLPRYFHAVHGGSSTVLELDEAIVDLAESELGLERGPWLEIATGDARLTLRATPAAYDAVVGDAFGGPSVPWHLTTVEFLEDVRDRLRPGGVYVMNVIDHPPLAFVRAEAATLAEVFDEVAVVATRVQAQTGSGGNFVLVAGSDLGRLDGMAFADGEVVVPGADFAGDGIVLTDDFAPADQLLGRP